MREARCNYEVVVTSLKLHLRNYIIVIPNGRTGNSEALLTKSIGILTIPTPAIIMLSPLTFFHFQPDFPLLEITPF